MPSLILLSSWLMLAALVSLALLIPGCMAVLCCREPVRRVLIIEMLLAASLLAPWMVFLPGVPHWSLPQGESPTSTPPREVALAELRVPEAPLNLPDAPRLEFAEQPTEVVMLPVAEATAPPAIASEPAARASRWPVEFRDIRFWVSAAYLVGIAGLGVWWLIGVCGLVRLSRRTQAAPESIRNLFREIAGPRGVRVLLLVAGRVEQPFTFVWRRPVIVLPERLCADGRTAELRWCLAHEWSHIERRDVWFWALAGLARGLYFYQPLVWWLRKELRLCQDYLADARAAAEASSPADYAEFLTTLTASRPAVGLGIGSRQSELFRRVVMLVQNPRPLETRCPRRWKVAFGFGAFLILGAVGTFRLHADAPAVANASPDAVGQVAEPAVPSERAVPRSTAANLADVDPTAAANLSQAAETRGESAAGAEDKTARSLVDLMLARSGSITSGRFEYRWIVETDGRNENETVKDCQFSISDRSRALRTILRRIGSTAEPGPANVKVEHAGRVLGLVNGSPFGQPIWSLTISRPPGMLELPSLGGGIWYRSTREFVREHAAQVQQRDAEPVNGLGVKLLEWDISPENAAAAFVYTNDFLEQGGKLRLFVAPAAGYALPRIEYADRFGTVHAVFDCSKFEELATGLYFPSRIDIRRGIYRQTFDINKIEKLNQPIAESDFVVAIPAGTKVTDNRIGRPSLTVYSVDRKANPLINGKPYPFAEFTTSVVYPNGLPELLLKEMDAAAEKTLSPVTTALPTPVSPPRISAAKTGKEPQAEPKKAHLRYSGKTFVEWREVLVNDLEATTREGALAALGAFGGNGYPEEVIAAVSAVLPEGEPAQNEVGFVFAAYRTIARCGDRAVPILTGFLKTRHKSQRIAAADALGAMHSEAKPAVPALIELTQDGDPAVAVAACRALAEIDPADDAIQAVMLAVLQAERHPGRDTAFRVLFQHGPATEPVLAALKHYIRTTNWQGVIQETSKQRPEIVIPLLLTQLDSRVAEKSIPRQVDPLIQTISLMGQFGPGAAPAVPDLLKLLEAELAAPRPEQGLVLAIAKTLGNIGPEAKAAVPRLTEIVESGEIKWPSLMRHEFQGEAPRTVFSRALEQVRGK